MNGDEILPAKMDNHLTKWTDDQQNGQMTNKMDTCRTKWTDAGQNGKDA